MKNHELLKLLHKGAKGSCEKQSKVFLNNNISRKMFKTVLKFSKLTSI